MSRFDHFVNFKISEGASWFPCLCSGRPGCALITVLPGGLVEHERDTARPRGAQAPVRSAENWGAVAAAAGTRCSTGGVGELSSQSAVRGGRRPECCREPWHLSWRGRPPLGTGATGRRASGVLRGWVSCRPHQGHTRGDFTATDTQAGPLALRVEQPTPRAGCEHDPHRELSPRPSRPVCSPRTGGRHVFCWRAEQ